VPSHLHLAHRRNARNAAKGRIVKTDSNIEKLRDRCREDFAFFCDYISEGKKKPVRHHLEWIEQLVTNENSSCLARIGGKDTVILAPRGPLDVNTPVATPNGWKLLSEIKIGDEVYGDDGITTKVIDTLDYGEAECWEVFLSDGTSVVCDDSHKWAVRLMGTDPKGTWRTVTLQEIRCFVTNGMKGNHRTGVSRTVRLAKEGEKPWLDTRGYAKYQVPISAPVQYEAKELPLDPYLLGVLIGDGALTTGAVRFHKPNMDIVARIQSALPENYVVRQVGSKHGDWRIVHKDGWKADRNGKRINSNPITEGLKELELWGCKSHEKFIPKEYLFGSIKQREALLQGILDTDGTCKRKAGKGGVSFSTSSLELMNDFKELVRSLGGIVTMHKVQNTGYKNKDGNFVKCKLGYRCGIRLPEGINPFFTSVKSELYTGPSVGRTNGGLVRSIVDIRPAGKRQIRCLTVENPDHRFLLRDYVVSLNSAKSTCVGLFTAWAIGIHAELKLPLKILYISYTVDVARPKSAAIKNTICSKRYQEIFPSVRLKKGATSNEYWSIDYKHAGIEETGDEQFTLCCAGLKGSITSKRSNLCLIDDCIKSAAEIANPDIRRLMQDNWNSVIAPTMFEGARAICLGTRFRHDDLFATTFIEANGWKQIVQQALITDDAGNYQSYWPEMWSVEYLLKKKKTAPISFSFQYMNQIVRQSELSLSPDLLIRSEIATEFDTIGIGVDLSSGLKEKNDYTVMTLGGRIGDKIHIIDYRRFRVMGNLEKLDKMMELLADWNLLTQDEDGRYMPTMNVCDIWSEAVQYQASLEADFKRICIGEHELHNLKWHPVKGFRSDKLARFRGIMGMFEQRKIVFNRYRGFMSMFDELTNFGTSSHDDCVDSLVHLVNGLMRRGSLEIDF
jgi:intein/homing endonuclease